ncbi:hypothetical protein DPMN_073171 [Dreissena polymorpha]|uniref:Uncharacterized protein n=1 Tax=Dreissena polymorpha TaxID=45954 RepID=A0A9D4BYJ7_DREPO|nr:hypothetical protein DPMN_073171 [Dreissena polymorpha]
MLAHKHWSIHVTSNTHQLKIFGGYAGPPAYKTIALPSELTVSSSRLFTNPACAVTFIYVKNGL